MALPTPITVDATAGGEELVPKNSDGYKFIAIRNLDDTHSLWYSLIGEDPAEDLCLELPADSQIIFEDPRQMGIGVRAIKGIAPAGQSISVYVEYFKA